MKLFSRKKTPNQINKEYANELKQYTEQLLDKALQDPDRSEAADRALTILKNPKVIIELQAMILHAKEHFGVEHAEINLLVSAGDIFIAGDSLVPTEEPRNNSYCVLILSGRPVVIRDSLTHFILNDNPYRSLVRSYLGTPMEVHGQVVGALCVYGSDPRTWTIQEETELSNLAKTITNKFLEEPDV